MSDALLDPLHDPRWARLAERAPQASVFHHPAWMGLVSAQYGYRLAAPAVLDAGGEAVAGVPVALIASRLTGRRIVALPFSDVCPPLVTGRAPADARARLAAALLALGREHRATVEVRGDLAELAPPVTRFHQHVVDLGPGVEGVERGYTPAVRRNVRTAHRLGVDVRREDGPAALEAFYALHVQTRRRLGVPTQPKRFVRGLGALLDRDLGFVSVARLDGRPVAAAVFLHAAGTLTYKFGASDRSFQHVRPTNALFADAIRWACGRGLRELDLGRTDLGHEGLRAFKRSWGAAETPLAYTYAGEPPGRGRSRAQRLAAPVIRRGPALVGRAVGEVLYRHAG
jgi:CelD/BcsL family acetyltransferase involved in cellulose biosynthesis